MGLFNTAIDKVGNWVAGRLREESSGYKPYTPSDSVTLQKTLQPGDVLLVEGNQKVSAVIKYLTQSTWSHAAIYVGDALDGKKVPTTEESEGEPLQLIEVLLGEGCVAVPLSKYETYNTRICRAYNVSPGDQKKLVDYMIDKLGVQYDVRNILDMLRYFMPAPPVPVRWRRKMLAFGSGEPTKAICSTLIAQAFQSIQYPILPEITITKGRTSAKSYYSKREILHIRHHSLFAPRDFDISPYFEIIKPTLVNGFEYKKLSWGKPVNELASDEMDAETEGAADEGTVDKKSDDGGKGEIDTSR